MKTVVTNYKGYNPQRNFYGNTVPGYTYQFSKDFFQVLNHLHYKLKGKRHHSWGNLHWCSLKKGSISHFFNTISLGSAPWVVTAEHYLPRSMPRNARAVKALASKSCKRIICMSEYSYNAQLNVLQLHPQYADAIKQKMCILQPPQQLIAQNPQSVKSGEAVRFGFVGTDFYRKGGLEALRAFLRLHKEGARFECVLISKMSTGIWKDSHITNSHRAEVKEILAQCKGSIVHHEYLPNAEAMRILASCHVGLLPSWGETYGYSVLEFQSLGCPVITTNVPPLDEVNNTQCGWIAEVPLIFRETGLTSDTYSPESMSRSSAVLEEALYQIIKKILDNPSPIAEKSQNCIDKIKNHHNPAADAARLAEIYNSAIQKEN